MFKKQNSKDQHAIWLSLGKDVWQLIFTMLVSRGDHKYDQTKWYDRYHGMYNESIGDYDYVQVQLLRSVCRTFSVWISPDFCLGIIYLNPVANTSLVIERWKDYFSQLDPCGGGPTYDEPNPFFGRKHIYLRTKWKWNFNPENREPRIAADDQILDIWRPEWEDDENYEEVNF